MGVGVIGRKNLSVLYLTVSSSVILFLSKKRSETASACYDEQTLVGVRGLKTKTAVSLLHVCGMRKHRAPGWVNTHGSNFDRCPTQQYAFWQLCWFIYWIELSFSLNHNYKASMATKMYLGTLMVLDGSIILLWYVHIRILWYLKGIAKNIVLSAS